MTPLHLACKYGCLNAVKLIIEKMNITGLTENENLISSLHCACSNKVENSEKILSIAKIILQKIDEQPNMLKEALNFRDKYNQNVVHISIQNNHYEVVKLLLIDYKADVNLSGGYSDNFPIHFAAQIGSKKILDLLIERNTQLLVKNKRNENAIHIAAIHDRSEFISYFLQKEIQKYKSIQSIKEQNRQWMTPIMSAAHSGHLKCVKELRNPIGLDINLSMLTDRDIEQRTIFHLCARKNRLDCLTYFLRSIDEKHVKHLLDQRDKYDNSIMHVACKHGNLSIVQFLLNSRLPFSNQINDKAKFELIFGKNNEEKNCFHVACENGHVELIGYILNVFEIY
jgi:ankyrin repeat protein